MTRNAQTMDAKDWIILRLMNAMVHGGMQRHPEYAQAARWAYTNLDLFRSYDGANPIEALKQEERQSRPDPKLMTSFPFISQRQLDNWRAEEDRQRFSDAFVERFVQRAVLAAAQREQPPAECLVIALMENDA